MKKYAAVIVSVLSLGCGVQEVVRSDNGLTDNGGASYYLPKTVIVVSVPVVKTVSKKVEFAEYSKVLMGVPGDVRGETSEYASAGDYSIAMESERDPGQKFVAVYPKGPFKTSSQKVVVNEEGILTSGEASVENKTVEFVVSSLAGVAKIASSVVKAAGGGEFDLIEYDREDLKKLAGFVNGLDKNGSSGSELDEDSLQFGITVLLEKANLLATVDGSTTAPALIKTSSERWKVFVNERPNGLRSLTAAVEEVKRYRDVSSKISTSRASADFQYFVDQRNSIFRSFAGRAEEKVTWVGVFRYSPGDIRKASKDLIYINKSKGLRIANGVKLNVLASDKFEISKSSLKDDTTIRLNWNSKAPAEAKHWQSQTTTKEKHGWYYRIPAKSELTITKVGGGPGKRLYRKDSYIAQHGCVAYLPATTHSQKISSTIELDPLTGALKSNTFGGTSFDPALAEKVGGSVSSVIDARAARPDYVAELERKKKILELQKAIDELENGTVGSTKGP